MAEEPFTPRRIQVESIPIALEKVAHFRLLNEPFLAESICRDVLAIQPDHDLALLGLLRSLIDQVAAGMGDRVGEISRLIRRLPDDYRRLYYAGLLAERRGAAALTGHMHHGRQVAYGHLRAAMDLYEQAMPLKPTKDDAVFRWNTCVRLIARYRLEAPFDDNAVQLLE